MFMLHDDFKQILMIEANSVFKIPLWTRDRARERKRMRTEKKNRSKTDFNANNDFSACDSFECAFLLEWRFHLSLWCDFVDAIIITRFRKYGWIAYLTSSRRMKWIGRIVPLDWPHLMCAFTLRSSTPHFNRHQITHLHTKQRQEL